MTEVRCLIAHCVHNVKGFCSKDRIEIYESSYDEIGNGSMKLQDEGGCKMLDYPITHQEITAWEKEHGMSWQKKLESSSIE